MTSVIQLYYYVIIVINNKYMRKVISLSLPEKTTKEIKSLSGRRGFSSVSSYIKHLIELDKDLISEEKLLSSIKQARKEYKGGKTIVAKSMSELI